MTVAEATRILKEAKEVARRDVWRARLMVNPVLEWARPLNTCSKYDRAGNEAVVAWQFVPDLVCDLEAAVEGFVPQATAMHLNRAHELINRKQDLFCMVAGEKAAPPLTAWEKAGMVVVIGAFALPVAVVLVEAGAASAIAGAAGLVLRAGATRVLTLSATHPTAVLEGISIATGMVISVGENGGAGPETAVDVVVLYLATRGTRGGGAPDGRRWVRVRARRETAPDGKPRYRVDKVDPVDGPPPQTHGQQPVAPQLRFRPKNGFDMEFMEGPVKPPVGEQPKLTAVAPDRRAFTLEQLNKLRHNSLHEGDTLDCHAGSSMLTRAADTGTAEEDIVSKMSSPGSPVSGIHHTMAQIGDEWICTRPNFWRMIFQREPQKAAALSKLGIPNLVERLRNGAVLTNQEFQRMVGRDKLGGLGFQPIRWPSGPTVPSLRPAPRPSVPRNLRPH